MPPKRRRSELLFSPTEAKNQNREDERRIDEKSRLSAYNKRLEMILLSQRKKAIAETDLRLENESLQNEKRRLEDLLEKEQKKSDRLTEEVQKLSGLIKAHESTIGQQNTRIEKLQRQLEGERTEKDKLAAELKTTRLELFQKNEQKQRLELELESVRVELDECQKRESHLIVQLSAAKAEIARLKKDLEREKARCDSLNKEWQLKYDAELNGRRQFEEDLKEDFGRQLKDFLALGRAQTADEREQNFQTLRQEFEAKIQEQRGEAEKAVGKVQEMAEKLREKLREAQIAADNAKLEVEKREAMQEATQRAHEKEMEVLQRNYSAREKKLGDEIASLRKELKEAEGLRDTILVLNEAKGELEMELKAYRLLLEDEETRLGLNRLIIHSLSIGDKLIKIKNVSDSPLELKGWRVVSRETKKELVLPPRSLDPEQTLRIVVGESAVDQGENEVAWVEDAWSEEGDMISLLDPTGRVAATVEVMKLVED